MSSIVTPDLVLRRGDQPIFVVEAKSLPVPAAFRQPVRIQLRVYAEQTGSPWALLIVPERALLFRSPDMEHPVATIPAHEIVREAGLANAPVIGGSILTTAALRWLRRLPESRTFLRRYPALSALAEALRTDDDLVAERSYA
jgi:hypothetical protein